MFPQISQKIPSRRDADNPPKNSAVHLMKPRSVSTPPLSQVQVNGLAPVERPNTRQRRESFINELQHDVARIRTQKGIGVDTANKSKPSDPSKLNAAVWPIGATFSEDFNYFPRRQPDFNGATPTPKVIRRRTKSTHAAIPRGGRVSTAAVPKRSPQRKQSYLSPTECRDRRRHEIASLQEMFEGLDYYDSRLAGSEVATDTNSGTTAAQKELKFDRGLFKFKLKNGEERAVKPERFRYRSTVDIMQQIVVPTNNELDEARETRANFLKSQEITEAVESCRNLETIREIMAAWHFSLPIRLVQTWRAKVGSAAKRKKTILTGIRRGGSKKQRYRETVRWCFFGIILQRLQQWKDNMTLMARMVQQQLERAAKELKAELEYEARSLLDTLLGTKGNEAITLMQMRPVMQAPPKTLRQEWSHFLLWFKQGRTMTSYDPENTGLLSHIQLGQALGEFRKVGWKFAGVLWD